MSEMDVRKKIIDDTGIVCPIHHLNQPQASGKERLWITIGLINMKQKVSILGYHINADQITGVTVGQEDQMRDKI